MKFSYLRTTIALLLLRTLLFVQFCVCFYKSVALSILSVSLLMVAWFNWFIGPFSFLKYLYVRTDSPTLTSKQLPATSLETIIDPNMPIGCKYLHILEFVLWSLFDTSNDLEKFSPAQINVSGFMIVGVAFNVYILIQILNVLNTIHAPRTKYFEIMNQLDAYMNKKQLPLHLQTRLKFFYKTRFRRFYYREDEILAFLSG